MDVATRLLTRYLPLLVGCALALPAQAQRGGAVQLNELRVDQPGTDDDEYAELAGPPGASLDGLTYLVIGDSGGGGAGVVEFVLDLAGETIPADGLFLIAEDDDTFGAEADLVAALNFENQDSVTHLLVEGFSGTDGQDLDPDDDGDLDVTPWTAVLDAVGLADDEDEPPYGAALGFVDLGPVGTFPPAHVYRASDTGAWIIGAFDPAESADTPGQPNPTGGDLPVVVFTAATATVAEGESTEVFVEIDYPDAPDGEPVVVAVEFDAGGSTADGSDFTYAPQTVTFSGTTDNEQAAVTITAVADGAAEGEEHAVFALAVPDGEAAVGTPGTLDVTIEDADAAETAEVQFIHNAPDPLVAVVDVVVEDAGGDVVLELDDLAFREATPLVTLPANEDLTITVSVEGFPSLPPIVQNLAPGTYVAVAVGTIDIFDPPSSDIEVDVVRVDEGGRGEPVDLVVNHGVPDAPTLDVVNEASGTPLVEDLDHLDTVELDVEPLDYVLALRTDPGGDVLATGGVDLTDDAGSLFSVLASGYLTPPFGAEAFALLGVDAEGNVVELLPPGTIPIQEARDLGVGATVTVEGVVTRAKGDFTYFQDETAGLTVRQTEGPFHEAVAAGEIAPGTVLEVTGTLSEFSDLLQINEDDLADYAVLGTTDVPAPQPLTLQEIVKNGETYEAELIEVQDLATDATGDFEPATSYDVTDPTVTVLEDGLRVPNAENSDVDGLPIPEAPFTFTGVLGQFTQFGDLPPDEGYQLLAIEATDIEEQAALLARLQVIHNAPDPAAEVVDVYVDGVLFLDDLAFRTATPFLDVSAGVPLEVAVAPGDSDGPDEAFFTEAYTLGAATATQLVAVGVLDPAAFEPNPSGISTAFTLLVGADALEGGGNPAFAEVRGVHGTPDAPAVDLYLPDLDVVLVDDVAYTDVSDYTQAPLIAAAVAVTPADDNDTLLATFDVDLTPYGGESLVALASGFLTPENEDDTAGTPPPLRLLLVFPDGTEEVIAPNPVGTEGAGALPEAFALHGSYPNPFATATTLRFDLPADAEVRVGVYDLLGREVLALPPQPVAAGAARTLRLDGSGLAAGVYVYRLTAEARGEAFTGTGRLTLVE